MNRRPIKPKAGRVAEQLAEQLTESRRYWFSSFAVAGSGTSGEPGKCEVERSVRFGETAA